MFDNGFRIKTYFTREPIFLLAGGIKMTLSYEFYLRVKEFGIAFNLISCLAVALIIIPLLILFFRKFWLYKPLILSVVMLAVSRLGTFFIWLQRNNGNPDSGEEFLQWFMPLGVMILICLYCLLRSVFSIRRFFHETLASSE